MIRFCSLLVLAATSFATQAMHHDPSTFQNTCSNIHFAYSGNDAALQATCLRADGTPNNSSLLITGIANNEGKLETASGASSFQRSCGNIQVLVDGPDVTLYAICRTSNGKFLESSMPLEGIENNDGNLSY